MIRRIFIGGLVAGMLAIASPSVDAGTFETDAQMFIEKLADRAVDTLTAADVPRPERIQRFRRIFNEHFAVHAIGRWILGRHWKKATAAEKAEYLALFEDLMVATYVDRFANYSNESLRITKTLTNNRETATVSSEIVQPNSSNRIKVDWRVGSKEGLFKIVDVVVEGASMSSTMRSDFGSIVRRQGGSIAGLIEALREKTEYLKASMK
jgi:phospholipid transport system substrate-binding protein